ncbi:MAG: BrnA antitoxin family protein [Alphaproteobacteria bacterium]|nr:BrnA antitoxin family protein [Alphaproteobacteria bacterium]MBV9373004.1 BrnA antitoxin family protein [Alphaproteobacteria bacterium]MBV9901371.1 BrnA antitoxin family protein [Alphaproteobacteria bacterium]
MNGKERDTTRGWSDPDEAPEWTDEMFDRAQISFGGHVIREATGTLTRRGRPPLGARAKVQQSLRLSPEVLEHFRATGQGWQARIDDVLRIHVRMVEEMKRHVAEARAGAVEAHGVGARAVEARVAEERAPYREDDGTEGGEA